MTTGDVLLNIRLEQGKTQQQFAQVIARSTRTYQNYEQDIGNISLTDFLKIISYCNVCISERSKYIHMITIL